MRYSTSQQQEMLKEQESSGLTVPQYCLKKGINEKRLYYWRKRMRLQSVSKFAQVVTEPRKEKVTIKLPEGIELQVAVGLLKTVLQELGSK